MKIQDLEVNIQAMVLSIVGSQVAVANKHGVKQQRVPQEDACINMHRHLSFRMLLLPQRQQLDLA
jgi:hypothetical protein